MLPVQSGRAIALQDHVAPAVGRKQAQTLLVASHDQLTWPSSALHRAWVIADCELVSSTRTEMAEAVVPCRVTRSRLELSGAGTLVSSTGPDGAARPIVIAVASSSSPPRAAETTVTALAASGGDDSGENPTSPPGRFPPSTVPIRAGSLVSTARLYGGATAPPKTDGSVAWPVTRP